MKIYTILFLVIMLTLFLSCDTDPTFQGLPWFPETLVNGVTITPTSATVNRGGTFYFNAEVDMVDLPDGQTTGHLGVTWTVSGNTSSETRYNHNTDGLTLFIASDETATTIVVNATSILDPVKSATATVTVPQVTDVVVSATTGDPSTSILAKGQSMRYEAIVNGTSDIPYGVIWSVAGGTSSSMSAEWLNVGINETSTLLTVTATSYYDNTKSGFATVRVVGYNGPAGGYVFYDKGSYSDGWRYLEAAPANYEFSAPWGLAGVLYPWTSNDIGDGQTNTTELINLLTANGETNRAAQLCDDLTINGYNDWFLPNHNELWVMYCRLRVGNNIGEFLHQKYWSSSSMYVTNDEWYQRNCTISINFANGQYDTTTSNRLANNRVRAIRAF